MATHPTPGEPLGRTITLSDGKTVTLNASYFQQQDTAIHARLAAPPLSDQELARRRAERPDEAWLWTREIQDAIRQADERHVAGIRGTIYNSDEELQASLDQFGRDDADV